MVLIDTHCHLDFHLFDPDREKVIERAHQRGISFFVNPGINLETSQAAIRLSELYPGIFAAVGIHPSEISTWNDEIVPELRNQARRSCVVAIGEIGLDYFHQPVDVETQKNVFIRQLEIAAEAGIPVIVHSRNSLDDVYSILSKWHTDLLRTGNPLVHHPGVLHSFEGDSKFAQKFIEINFFIGVGGPVTYNNAIVKQDLVNKLPIDRLLLETDAPFLPPQPYRGQRNEPAYLFNVAEKIASIKNETLAHVGDITTANATQLFQKEFTD